MTDLRTRPAGTAAVPGPSDRERGFAPAARRRNRIAFGVVLAAVAVGANVLVYAGLDDAQPVVQSLRDIPAGAEITPDMLGTVDVDADSTVNLVPAADLAALVGTYAKVRIVAGSLVTRDQVQSVPLVTPGSAIVAVQVPDGSLPTGLRERVPVLLVVPASGDAPTAAIEGRVVGLPATTGSALGLQSVSVEVTRDDAVTIAASDDIRVVLIEPDDDGTGES